MQRPYFFPRPTLNTLDRESNRLSRVAVPLENSQIAVPCNEPIINSEEILATRIQDATVFMVITPQSPDNCPKRTFLVLLSLFTIAFFLLCHLRNCYPWNEGFSRGCD